MSHLATNKSTWLLRTQPSCQCSTRMPSFWPYLPCFVAAVRSPSIGAIGCTLKFNCEHWMSLHIETLHNVQLHRTQHNSEKQQQHNSSKYDHQHHTTNTNDNSGIETNKGHFQPQGPGACRDVSSSEQGRRWGRQTLMRSMWGIMPWNVTAWNGNNVQVSTGQYRSYWYCSDWHCCVPGQVLILVSLPWFFCAGNNCSSFLVGIVSAFWELAHHSVASLGMGTTRERHVYKNTREVIVWGDWLLLQYLVIRVLRPCCIYDMCTIISDSNCNREWTLLFTYSLLPHHVWG